MNIANTLYRLKYRYGNRLPLKVPVDLSLELSSACNMACGYCYHSDPKNLPFKRGVMDLALATRAIEEASHIGVSSLKFNYRGEATQNPYFSKIVEYSSKFNFIDRILNSNFKFDTNKNEIFIAMCTLTKVKVSYDSFIKDVFEKQRAKGDHDLSTRNIDKFYNFPIRDKTQLVIQAVRTNLNKDEDIYGEVKKRWPEAQVSIRDMVEGRVNKDLADLKHKERAAERQSCLQAHVRLILNHDGKVSHCCPDIKNELSFFTYPDKSLSEIFNSYEAKLLRKSLKSGEAFLKDPCKTCSSFESYKGYKHPWHS